jgi:hypothetical protein
MDNSYTARPVALGDQLSDPVETPETIPEVLEAPVLPPNELTAAVPADQ